MPKTVSRTEPGWTPGPWRVIQPIALDYRAPLIYGADRASLVAQAEGGGPKRAIVGAEARANAFLMAAAPELYEVLTWFADLPDEGFDEEGRRQLTKARAALTKARGEMP